MAEGLLVPQSILDNLPTMVRHELASLPPQRQQEFVEEFKRKAKSTGTAYVLWFFLGWHYMYQGKWGTQVLYWVTAAGLFIWAIVDLFRIPGLIRDYNKDVAMDTLRNLKAIAS